MQDLEFVVLLAGKRRVSRKWFAVTVQELAMLRFENIAGVVLVYKMVVRL